MIRPIFPNVRRSGIQSGFTLIELLVVMSIMLIMLGLAAASFQSLGRTADITNSIQSVADTLNLARQLAVSRNEYTQVRFYSPKSTSADYRAGNYTAMKLFRADSPYYYSDENGYSQVISSGRMHPEGHLIRLPQSCVILSGSSTYSPLIQALATGTAGMYQFTGAKLDGIAYDGVAFYFKPDGSIDVPATTSGSATVNALSICAMQAYVGAGNKIPANYGIINLDRINGRFQIIRP